MSREFIKKVFALSLGVPLLWVLLSAMKFIPESTIPFAIGIGFGGILTILFDVLLKIKDTIQNRRPGLVKEILSYVIGYPVFLVFIFIFGFIGSSPVLTYGLGLLMALVATVYDRWKSYRTKKKNRDIDI